jgi:UDP-N-acetylmuramoyl-L-alanyl-D-glutamate--2,6-diaminopimelate ligase
MLLLLGKWKICAKICSNLLTVITERFSDAWAIIAWALSFLIESKNGNYLMKRYALYHPPRKITLSSVLEHFPRLSRPDFQDVQITGVVADSRQVEPGNLFVALVGGSADGHRFIPQSIQRGAAAVVGMQPLSGLEVPYIRVEDSRYALAHLAAAYYGFPAHKMVVVGITGTDGKTTTANLLFNILRTAGLPTGMISTVNAVIGEIELDTGFHVTTPDATDVQRYLAMMTGQGITHVILEATSHGLAQFRVEACEFDVAVVTNITHEHLDYHGSYEEYRAAKARLFKQLDKTPAKVHPYPRTGILNRDDISYEYLSALTSVDQLTYGLHPQSQVQGNEIDVTRAGSTFLVRGPGFNFPAKTKLMGDYNVSNCLAAIAAAVGVLRVEPEAAQAGIENFSGVPGRMESIDLGQDFTAIVDFAHTPNALRRALETAQQMTNGKVIAVYGSAGLRDRAKRRMMAEVSGELADISILTAEDPRTESLQAILDEMAEGVESRGGVEGMHYWREPDRGEAIRMAVAMASPGDLVIACGKGHEQSMCFGVQEYAWDDRVAMRAALAEYLGVPGPEMPYLPTRD